MNQYVFSQRVPGIDLTMHCRVCFQKITVSAADVHKLPKSGNKVLVCEDVVCKKRGSVVKNKREDRKFIVLGKFACLLYFINNLLIVYE